jgi:hypothetical protein
MTDAALIGGAITSLNAAMNIAKGLISVHDVSTIQGNVIELQSEIMAAQSSALSAAQSEQFALRDRMRELEKEIACLKAWTHERTRYEMKPLIGAGVAYMLKPEERGSEPPHWICQNCYENGRAIALIKVLEKFPSATWKCPHCAATIALHSSVKPSYG